MEASQGPTPSMQFFREICVETIYNYFFGPPVVTKFTIIKLNNLQGNENFSLAIGERFIIDIFLFHDDNYQIMNLNVHDGPYKTY